jgi:hypothetical protein
LAQLRHVRTAERSGKGAIEDQQDVLLAAEIGQTDRPAMIVGQAEVGSDLMKAVLKMPSTQRRKDAKAQSIFVVMGVLRP